MVVVVDDVIVVDVVQFIFRAFDCLVYSNRASMLLF